MRRRNRSALALILALASLAPAGAEAHPQSMRTVSMSRQLDGDGPVEVAVDYAAGAFRVRSLDEGLLYRMNLRYDESRFEPVAEYSSRRLVVGVEPLRRRGRGRSSGELTLELARGVPIDLDLDFGAVQADVDLGGLTLTRLDVSTGASEATLDVSEPNPNPMRLARFEVGAADFTARRLGNLNAERIDFGAGVGSVVLWLDGAWQRDARVSIDIGLGSLKLHVPEGLGLQLQKSSFFTALDSEGLVKRGDTYSSPDWEQAERRVTIDLDAAFGSVEVVWIH